jgi:hypothetical protein
LVFSNGFVVFRRRTHEFLVRDLAVCIAIAAVVIIEVKNRSVYRWRGKNAPTPFFEQELPRMTAIVAKSKPATLETDLKAVLGGGHLGGWCIFQKKRH